MRAIRFTLVLTAVTAAAAMGCAAPETSSNSAGTPGVEASVPVPAGVSGSAGSVAGSGGTAQSPTSDDTMTTDGVGPYRIGARVEELRAAGLLGRFTPVDKERCREVWDVAATGRYAGRLQLVVREQMLVEVGTAGGDPVVHSPEGATIGTEFDQLRKMFGKRGSTVKDPQGAEGFVVRKGDRVMLFRGHPIRPGVGYLAVGKADHTEHVFRTGEPC